MHNDKSDEMLSLLTEIKSSINEHRNETKWYAAILAEMKDNSQSFKSKHGQFPMFSSVAPQGNKSSNAEFPPLISSVIVNLRLALLM